MNKQPSHSSKGFTIIEIAVAVVIIAIIAGAGYLFLAQRNGSGIANPFSKVTLNPNCEYNDADLCKFLNNWKEQKNYAISTTSNNPDEADVVSTFEFEDGKSHILIKQGESESYNIITIGDTTYTKDNSDGKWWKQVASASNATEDYTVDFDDNPNDNTDADRTTYTKRDKEACGARNCFVYEVTTGADQDSKELIYFDDKDYILRQTVSEYDGFKSTSIFTYGQVKINEPSPVKEASADQIILPGGQTEAALEGVSEEDLEKLQELMPNLGQ